MAKRKAHRGPKAKPRASIAWIDPGELKTSFALSAWQTNMREIMLTGMPLGVVRQHCASGELVVARNDVVEYFLGTDVDWVWFVDADMVFDEMTFDRLYRAADPVERPIVGGLCFGVKNVGGDSPLPVYRMFPTVYQWKETETEAGFAVATKYPRDQMVEVSATGAACVLVHRSVLEKIRDEYGPAWFDRLTHPKVPKPFGEDLSFFVRAAAVGAPTFVHTGIKIAHDKGALIATEERWDEQEAARVAAEQSQPAVVADVDA